MAKTYKCPYCDKRFLRPKLVDHIDKVHSEMIPEGYDSYRVVYDSINKNTPLCRVCKRPTPWNFKSHRYDVLCGDPKCKQKMREDYKRNMLRVRGTYNILNDPEQQKLMLANRRISGVYKHSDGGTINFTGSYEKALLEFLDSFMQIESEDIMSPGPTMEYMYQGQKHIYIPDFYIISLNLIIEIKDGGDNLNGKQTPGMISSREKTIEKERVVTDRGEYNYVRLTNNQFEQLIDIIMAMKEKAMNGDTSMTVKINESTVIEEASSILPKQIIDLNTRLNMFEYILPNHGNIIINITADDYFCRYYYLTVKEFEKYNGGVCWDYVRYEHYCLNKIGIKHNCYFVMFPDGVNDPTHTFIIFQYAGKYYWFESAWKRHIGIFGYNTEREALLGICHELYLWDPKVALNLKLKEVHVSVYDPESIPDGTSCEEFYGYQARFTHKYPISSVKNSYEPFIKINTRQELPKMEETIDESLLYDPEEDDGDSTRFIFIT